MIDSNLFWLIFKLLWWFLAIILVLGVAVSAWGFKSGGLMASVFENCLLVLVFWVGLTAVGSLALKIWHPRLQ